MSHWSEQSIFYHIYPLGCFGAPSKNDQISPPVHRIKELEQWIPHLKDLHINALYLGPLFESTNHGYDTIDYFRVDRRLGDNRSLQEMIALLHRNGIRVILDAVFNHTGRDFFAFRDLQTHEQNSVYTDLFSGIDFRSTSPYSDAFHYDGWNDHYDLVKLNLQNPDVVSYLLKAVTYWMEQFQIDGLRMDAADCVDISFLKTLNRHCKQIDKDFWIMGEIIHGDYSRWTTCGALDSVTNYECYKGLYSSHNDHNYFEIAYSLNRQFGPEGMYRHFLPYTFADNHDVNRLTSTLTNPEHVFPLYCLLFSMPGIPSIYYGSEWGTSGSRTATDDHALRPHLEPVYKSINPPFESLPAFIARLSEIRLHSPALQHGMYRQVFVNSEQFAFLRQCEEETLLCVFNASLNTAQLELEGLPSTATQGTDILSNTHHDIEKNRIILNLSPSSGMIIALQP